MVEKGAGRSMLKRIGDWLDIQVTLVAMVLELEFEKEKKKAAQ